MAARQPGADPIKKAIVEIRELRAQLKRAREGATEPLAIVGVGLRLPGGVRDADGLWTMLHDGVDTIREIPAERWDLDAFYDPDPEAPGKMTTRYGAFLDGIDGFDARFFGVAPREAAAMDPQQRLLLETVWEALEDAGTAPGSLAGSRTGVFVGISNSDYARLLFRDLEAIDAYPATGTALSVAAGRISYLLGLRGPSLSVDTACSSSLVALHQACQSLRAGECDVALAGGINLILTPELNINFSKANMMAPDGRCKTFDARADGYVRGEGCAMIALRRLSDARRRGDRILALIRGSAVNQDGRSSALTVPNGPAQEAVLRDALAASGLEPGDVEYVEAHGTGTSLGDPIEVHALGAVFAAAHAERPLTVGSIKTNVGHLEAAAGIAGVLKAALALSRETIPPNLHFAEPNPHIDWEPQRVQVPTEPLPWPRGDRPRRAGVSSFGFSGTNAHVVLEEAPADPRPETVPRSLAIVCVSGADAGARAAQARATAGRLHVAAASGESLDDLCWTLSAGRTHFAHRIAAVGEDARALAGALEGWLAEGEAEGVFDGHHDDPAPPKVAFFFSGQGGQYPDMGRALYESEPAYRAAFDRCAELLDPHLRAGLLDVVFGELDGPGGTRGGGDRARIDQTDLTQPAVFAVQYALAELWKSWGVVPDAVIGHSFGQFAAACVAGYYGLEDGLLLARERGRLASELPARGAMVAVFADAETTARYLAPHGDAVSVAAANAPDNTVIAGEAGAVRAVLEALDGDGVEYRNLNIDQGFHCKLIEPLLEPFGEVVGRVAFREPERDLISNLTGKLAEPDELSRPEAWVRHARETVQFHRSMETAVERGCRVFIELGPHSTVLSMARRAWGGDGFTWLPSLRKGMDDRVVTAESLAELYAAGGRVDWDAFWRDHAARRVAAPTYAWQRKRFWTDAGTSALASAEDPAARWERVRAEAGRQAAEVPIDLELASYPAKWAALDRVADDAIARALRRLGLFAAAGEAHTVSGALAAGKIQEAYAKLVSLWLEGLVRRGWLRRDGERYVADEPLPETDPQAALAAAEPGFRDAPHLIEYAGLAAERLDGVLTGEISALDTLFPEGSLRIADPLYRESPMARYFNGIAREAVRAAIERERGPVRALEIGAGTGGTTSSILPVLPPERSLYCFTDLSEFFFSRARERFAKFPFVRYGLFDAEKSPEEQGYPEGGFDLVVAANVLHATRDLGAALRHARALLAPGGLIVLYETTAHPHWFNITLGLIEGWQRHEDALRGADPLLPAARWRELLVEHGFEETFAFPEEGSPAEAMSCHIVVGRVPGAPGGARAGLALGGLAAAEDAAAGAAPDAGGVESADAAATAAAAFRAEFDEAPEDERPALLADAVAAQVRRVLRMDADEPLSPRHRLIDLGLDSLMAVELRDRLRRRLGLERRLPATLVFDHPTVEAIAAFLVGRLAEESDGGASAEETAAAASRAQGKPAETSSSREVAEADVESMSDDEVAELLSKRLEDR